MTAWLALPKTVFGSPDRDRHQEGPHRRLGCRRWLKVMRAGNDDRVLAGIMQSTAVLVTATTLEECGRPVMVAVVCPGSRLAKWSLSGQER